MLTVDVGRCDGCGVCVYACPEQAVSLVEGVARIDFSKCTECGVCVDGCPQEAIQVARPIVVQPEGKLVSEEETVPKTTVVGLATAALGFVGRYLVPRAIDAIADVLARRVSEVLPYEDKEPMKAGESAEASRPSPAATGVPRTGGRRRRYRGGR